MKIVERRMAIEFKYYDNVNIIVNKDGFHIATIRNFNSGVIVDIDDSLEINDLEQIITKMKELQNEKT